MEIILKETIDTLGQVGDVVKVKPGYARNYLLPKKKAVVANISNLAIRDQEQQNIQTRLDNERKDSQSLLDSLSGVTIEIARKVGDELRLFGSVTSADIAEKLQEKGITVDRRAIMLNDPIKTAGEKTITVKTGYQMVAEITVQVIAETIGDEA